LSEQDETCIENQAIFLSVGIEEENIHFQLDLSAEEKE
jgi:hypothetical protein